MVASSTVSQSSIEHLWDVVEQESSIMDVQLTNVQQLCDAISEERFQDFGESMQCRIKAVLKAEGDSASKVA